MSSPLERWCQLLETHLGRDRVLRTAGYVCLTLSDIPLLVSGQERPKIAQRLATLSSQISGCRTILRLVDDLPALNRTLKYGWGQQEKDKWIRYSTLISNLISHLYYPLEHIAWAADRQIIRIRETRPFWKTVACCWVASLYLALVRAVRTLALCLQQRTYFVKNRKFDQLSGLNRVVIQEILTIMQLIFDLGQAINLLPAGILWAGKLRPWQVGTLGFFASFIGLLKLLRVVP